MPYSQKLLPKVLLPEGIFIVQLVHRTAFQSRRSKYEASEEGVRSFTLKLFTHIWRVLTALVKIHKNQMH